MNQRKVGAPFEHSHSYIHSFLAFIKIGFRISYRTVQGIVVRGPSDYIIKIEEEMHFTHIRRGLLKIKRSSVGNLGCEEEYNKSIRLIVDALGLTITKKGDYIEDIWIRKKKEFIKLHIAVDALSKNVLE